MPALLMVGVGMPEEVFLRPRMVRPVLLEALPLLVEAGLLRLPLLMLEVLRELRDLSLLPKELERSSCVIGG